LLCLIITVCLSCLFAGHSPPLVSRSKLVYELLCTYTFITPNPHASATQTLLNMFIAKRIQTRDESHYIFYTDALHTHKLVNCSTPIFIPNFHMTIQPTPPRRLLLHRITSCSTAFPSSSSSSSSSLSYHPPLGMSNAVGPRRSVACIGGLGEGETTRLPGMAYDVGPCRSVACMGGLGEGETTQLAGMAYDVGPCRSVACIRGPGKGEGARFTRA
jgi:hypothetical protein